MLRNIRAFSVASLRVAARPRFPSRTVVPLIATGTFAAVAVNHFLVSGCVQCLEDAGGDSSPVIRQISQVKCTVKPNDLKSMSKVTNELKDIKQLVDELFPDDTELRDMCNQTHTDSRTLLDTLGLVYLRNKLLIKYTELKSKVEEMKRQYPEHVAVSDVKDREEDNGKAELLDGLEGEQRAKQDKPFHRKQVPHTRPPNGVRSA